METKLYRILVKTTGSCQPDRSTHWAVEVAYCGYDRLEAIRVLHANRPLDYWGGYGCRARETVAQSKCIAEAV